MEASWEVTAVVYEIVGASVKIVAVGIEKKQMNFEYIFQVEENRFAHRLAVV